MEQENYTINIGKRCQKKRINPKSKPYTPNPFKSGLKINTIKGLIKHPQLPGQLAYIFQEDDSYVECRRCEIVT